MFKIQFLWSFTRLGVNVSPSQQTFLWHTKTKLAIGLVKTESGFIVRSVETSLGRWTLVVAVISVDGYPFLAFSDLICHLEDTGMGVFWSHCAA